MLQKISLFLLTCSLSPLALGQALLQADGPGDTYELINAVLAPGYNVVEVPDCSHADFGRHITEVFDSVLNAYVFQFHIHTSPDDDRCLNDDRQRNEIKTYDKSPDSLLAVEDEVVRYTWKFKLASDFQPSSAPGTNSLTIKLALFPRYCVRKGSPMSIGSPFLPCPTKKCLRFIWPDT